MNVSEGAGASPPKVSPAKKSSSPPKTSNVLHPTGTDVVVSSGKHGGGISSAELVSAGTVGSLSTTQSEIIKNGYEPDTKENGVKSPQPGNI